MNSNIYTNIFLYYKNFIQKKIKKNIFKSTVSFL
ncbi:hypothetical protein pb186bvf_015330 [Paramecium bursaria]